MIPTEGKKFGYSLLSKNFALVNLNKNNERELWIAYKRILVLETSGFLDTPDSLSLRQVSDGRRLVQLVTQHGEIKDCEYTKNFKTILSFIDKFVNIKSVISKSIQKNVTEAYSSIPVLKLGSAYSVLKDRSSLGIFKNYVDLKHQRQACHLFYRRVRKEAHRRKLADETSRKRNRTKKNRRGTNESISKTRLRVKRDLLSGWFIFPGTKWCGDGDIAESYDDLGYDIGTDSCCRKHDNCKYIIERFTWKYNLFNYRFTTMSHCECDNRFRKCLKQSTSATAHLMGKIFFNVIAPQCFHFKKKKVCKRRNWWGVCKKYGLNRIAFPRKSREF
ncbi:group 3 secretory phospholipase A2-like [Gigantopelta aegis]|uniref:group 3 secretory phospholipase A2-like n=1 Tax=Gigantopelta aegis TaxID=1735272 RepID=UPI001B88ACF4|nr:group 3 secretory phospholipase A2-like [Gigantopelta aegis]